MPRRGPQPKGGALRASVVSDGTLAGTVVLMNGHTPLRHVQAVDVRIDPHGATCTVSVGHVAVDHGPTTLELRDADLHLQPGVSPREP